MTSTTSKRFSPEVRGRTVRMVGENRADYASPWVALLSIAGKMGYRTETLRLWCREEASPKRSRLSAQVAQTSDDKARPTLLEREAGELPPANAILGAASAYFAQAELDRREKW